MDPQGFPAWLRAEHVFNLFLMILLVRSGIQILVSDMRNLGEGEGGSQEDLLYYPYRAEI
jgi:hypothetical protein